MKRKTIILMLLIVAEPLFGCSVVPPSSSISSSSDYYDQDTKTDLGTHVIKKKKLDSFFASSSSEYSILLPSSADEKTKTAASEIKKYVYEASGVSLEVKESIASSNEKVVSLGDTSRFRTLNYVEKYDLKNTGYHLFCQDASYFVTALSSKGLLNGAYGFLNMMIGFQTFAKDEIDFEKGDIRNQELDVIEVPDIEYRIGNNGKTLEGDEKYRERLLYDSTEDTFMMVGGSLWHNAFSYIDPEANKANTAWFSEADGIINYKQLCYSAHGSAEEKAKMLGLVADKIVETAKTSPINNVTFMQADSNSWCQCPACREEREKYGTDSAVLIHFLNPLSDLLAEKMAAASMGDRTINICFFAYEKTEVPPTKKSVDGIYSPMDESVVLRPNVTVFYAPIFADFNSSFDGAENKSVAEAFKAWKVISKKIYAWTYQTNFSYYLYPYNSLPTMKDKYRFLVQNSVEYLWDESQWDQDVPTAFHSLKNYMSAKLSWNCSLDYETLLQSYFSQYFKAGSSAMKQYYDELSAHLSYLHAEKGMAGGIYASVSDPAFFPKSLLDQWLSLFDQAFASIAGLAVENPEIYERAFRRLKIESLFVRYALIGLYPGRYSKDQLSSMKKDFVDDCYLYNVTRVSETVDIQTVFDTWDI